MKRIEHTIRISEVDLVDIKLWVERGIINALSINYRTLLNGEFHPVYRVDTFHGPLHEHRFWQGGRAIPLQNDWLLPLNLAFQKYKKQILENLGKYKEYYREALNNDTLPKNEKGT